MTLEMEKNLSPGGSGEKQQSGLRPGFTPHGMWAFSIGTSIGWGSFIVTCNTYLRKSGLLGTVFGLLVGLAVILVRPFDLSGDFMGKYHFASAFRPFFLGDAFQRGFHYNIFGYEVWQGEALLSICAVVIVGYLCAKSPHLPDRIMVIAALVFTAGFTICALAAIFLHGSTFRYSPLYTEKSSAFSQIVHIAAISPWAFEELLGKLGDHNAEAVRSGGIVIACGMARFEEDDCVAAVFERADQSMYENKALLKAAKKSVGSQ